jgi:ribonuclease D
LPDRTQAPSNEELPVLRDDASIAQVVSEARAAHRFGLDTEFLREKTYRARLCLVQVSTPDGVYLIDPLESVDLAPLGDLIADEGVEVIVHAGRQDFELFYERFGVVPGNVFDVQLAAAFAGYGASLPYGRLVETITGTSLEKGESYTDWCRRPLTTSQLTYAADDVRYLIEISDRLRQKLESLGRLDWALNEMSSFETADAYGTEPSEAWRKVSGRGSLSGRQAAALRGLAAWREESAARRDLPRGWIIKDQTLIEIARRMPATQQALKGIRGINAREAERSADQIIEAIERSKKAASPATTPAPPRHAQARARMLSGLADAVVRARCESAEMATELVSTRGELEALLADLFAGSLDPKRHRLLQGWRRELAGDAVVALGEGRIAVRSIDKPPYVEEVEL